MFTIPPGLLRLSRASAFAKNVRSHVATRAGGAQDLRRELGYPGGPLLRRYARQTHGI